MTSETDDDLIIEENYDGDGISSGMERFLRTLALSVHNDMWDRLCHVERWSAATGNGCQYSVTFDVSDTKHDHQDFGSAYGRALYVRGYVLAGAHRNVFDYPDDGIIKYTIYDKAALDTLSEDQIYDESDVREDGISRRTWVESKLEEKGL